MKATTSLVLASIFLFGFSGRSDALDEAENFVGNWRVLQFKNDVKRAVEAENPFFFYKVENLKDWISISKGDSKNLSLGEIPVLRTGHHPEFPFSSSRAEMPIFSVRRIHNADGNVLNTDPIPIFASLVPDGVVQFDVNVVHPGEIGFKISSHKDITVLLGDGHMKHIDAKRLYRVHLPTAQHAITLLLRYPINKQEVFTRTVDVINVPSVSGKLELTALKLRIHTIKPDPGLSVELIDIRGSLGKAELVNGS